MKHISFTRFLNQNQIRPMKPRSNDSVALMLLCFALLATTCVEGDVLYISSVNNNKIYRIYSDGSTNAFANISLLPEGLAFSPGGVLYVANDGANLINRVNTLGGVGVFVTNVAQPYGLAFDSKTNLYAASNTSYRVKKITPQGVVTNFGPIIGAPYGLAIDAGDNVYVTSNYGQIYKITPSGGLGVFGFVNGAVGLAFDKKENLYVSASTGTITKITPAGAASAFVTGLSSSLVGLAFDNAGNLYAAEYVSGAIYKIAPDQTLTRFATVPGGPSFIAVYPPPKFDPGPISIAQMGDAVVVSWFGNFVLQSAPDLASQFLDVVGATSPYTNVISSFETTFFRLRN